MYEKEKLKGNVMCDVCLFGIIKTNDIISGDFLIKKWNEVKYTKEKKSFEMCYYADIIT